MPDDIDLSEFHPLPAPQTLKDGDLLAEIERRGFVAYKPELAEPVAEFNTARLRGKRFRVGVVCCTHFGSRYQQPSALARFCSYAAREARVHAFIHAGDVTDGPLEMHKGLVHEQFLHTYDAQRDYAAAKLPRHKGVPWYLISGNHDDSFLKNAGGEIVRSICEQRDDLNYLGRSLGQFRVGDVLIEVIHEHMGGAYALSYRLKKHIESLSPERKPNVVLLGNYHKVCHIDYRNVVGLMLPAFQLQTPFMATKSLVSQVGGVILDIGITNRGLAPSIRTEWLMEREPRPNDYEGPPA